MDDLRNLSKPSKISALLFQVCFHSRLQDAGRRSTQPWVWIFDLPLSSCVSLGRWFNHLYRMGLSYLPGRIVLKTECINISPRYSPMSEKDVPLSFLLFFSSTLKPGTALFLWWTFALVGVSLSLFFPSWWFLFLQYHEFASYLYKELLGEGSSFKLCVW